MKERVAVIGWACTEFRPEHLAVMAPLLVPMR
jgi:hypothetical protein